MAFGRGGRSLVAKSKAPPLSPLSHRAYGGMREWGIFKRKTDFQSVFFRTDWKSILRRITEILSGQFLRSLATKLIHQPDELAGVSIADSAL